MIFTYKFVQNKFQISFYNKLFLRISTAFPPPPPWQIIRRFLYDVWNVKTTTICKKTSLVTPGKHFSKTFFLFSICQIAKTEVSTHIFQLVLVQWEKRFCRYFDSLTFYLYHRKKYHFHCNFSLVIFHGQSFIKTVRGPFISNQMLKSKSKKVATDLQLNVLFILCVQFLVENRIIIFS